MSETCLACGHQPHAHRCGAQSRGSFQSCECPTWVRPEIATAEALININNLLMGEIPKLVLQISDVLAILCEAFPEAVASVDRKREEFRKKLEDEKAKASQQHGSATNQTGQDSGTGGTDGLSDSRLSTP